MSDISDEFESISWMYESAGSAYGLVLSLYGGSCVTVRLKTQTDKNTVTFLYLMALTINITLSCLAANYLIITALFCMDGVPKCPSKGPSTIMSSPSLAWWWNLFLKPSVGFMHFFLTDEAANVWGLIGDSNVHSSIQMIVGQSWSEAWISHPPPRTCSHVYVLLNIMKPRSNFHFLPVGRCSYNGIKSPSLYLSSKAL